jgi:hypothetical protein
MPMNCHARCEMFEKYCSCFAHQVKRLKALASNTTLLKSNNPTLSSPNVATLVEAKAPIHPTHK